MINKTYIVNLARRKDKREHMENEISRLNQKGININHCFFEAVDGNNSEILSKYQFNIPNWFDPNSGKAMTNGEVGCALSHYSIWKDIVTSVENKILPDDCNVLIVEDDVIFMDNFLEKFKLYTGEIKCAYDMVYVHRKPLNASGEPKISQHIIKIKKRKSYWTCGYVLTYSGAKKLVDSNYTNNLIPVDEFLPIMYECDVFGYEKIYQSCAKLKCYAITPSLLKLTSNAFTDSETFHSEPCLDNNNFVFGDNKKFTMIYIGPLVGHKYQRFVYYCKLYAIPCIMIDYNDHLSQIHLLKTELESWSTEKINSTLIMVISITKLDQCDIIPIAPPTEIVEKFLTMATNENSIIVCKTDSYNGKMLFCAWGNKIQNLINQYFEKSNNSIKNITLSQVIRLYSGGNNFGDNKYEIFQLLNKDNAITFDHKSSRIINAQTKTTPSIIFANDENSVILLNKIENYTGTGWNEYYGYRISTNNGQMQKILSLPSIYMSFNLGYNNNILKIIHNIDYPKELLTIKINRIGENENNNENNNEIIYKDENDLHRQDIINFLESDAQYYFFIDRSCVFDNPKILKELLATNKDVVAPFLRRGNEAWTNFWGDLDEKGYYKRSFDYFDIIDNKRQGCWNVPYITGSYLIKREIIESNPTLFDDNIEIDLDMRLCYNLRSQSVFMYVSNINRYGYLEDMSKPTANLVQPVSNSDPNKEVSLYDIFNRKEEWENKYLHPKYLQFKNNLEKIPYSELCNDIYNFPLFSEIFCVELIARMESYGKWSKGKDEHNDPRLGKNYYENVPTVDVQLFEVGLDKHWHEIVFSYIAPMTRVLYNSYKTKDINLAFVVKYRFEDQSSLAPHHDASTYTVNIALNSGNHIDYENGGCRFIRQNYVLKNQDPGMCCIHPGRLTAYHEGLPITWGTRYILVSFIN